MKSKPSKSGRILITGSTGYLGGRLSQYLCDAGLEIQKSTRAELDFSQPEKIQSTSLNGVEAVIHLAACNERTCRENPLLASKINILGTQALLDAAIQSNVKRFIYLSTAHVYGAPLEGRLTEDTIPRPKHPYGITHLAAEEFVLATQAQGKIEGIVIRLSNVLGAPASPKADCWMLLPHDLCRQAVQGESLSLKSAGVQQRDFLPMSDFLKGIEFFLKIDKNRLADGLFNLGSSNSISIRDVAQMIREKASHRLGKEISLSVPNPAPSDRATSLDYSTNKLQQAGFSVRSSVSEALDELLEFVIKVFR